MSVMQVEVVSSEQNIYSGEASFVVVPTVQGELGIYPRHEPIMSLVRPGALRLTVPGEAEEVLVAVSGGVLEVQPDKIPYWQTLPSAVQKWIRRVLKQLKKQPRQVFLQPKMINLWPKRTKHWQQPLPS